MVGKTCEAKAGQAMGESKRRAKEKWAKDVEVEVEGEGK